MSEGDDVADGSVLRLVDRVTAAGRRVVVSWEAPRRSPREAGVAVDVQVDAVAAEKIRWYLEDYGEFPADPAPGIAAETERALGDIGRALFTAVFGGGDAAAIWAQATLGGVAHLRVEVDADPDDAPGLPWELLRDPATDQPLALAAGQFVRTHRQAATAAALPAASGDELRVLLVICRPEREDDVPFRSVASRLVRGGADRLPGLELQVLRPATYARLADVLRTAAHAGRPFHVVHFDGHGAYLDADALVPAGADPAGGTPSGAGGGRVGISPLRYAGSSPRPGRHGYLLFENPAAETNQELVDGPMLARLLTETDVPVLVLNACRSAYSEAQREPAGTSVDVTEGGEPDDVHERIRAYGSLAAEVTDAGVPGVVAMRYNVYVVTAAQYVADLYGHLVAGESLGLAASRARKALADDPRRQIGAVPVTLMDWVVPTVYEAAPLRLLAPRAAAPSLVRIEPPEASGSGAPGAPDVGFFGRDETLLALDRAFDTRRTVLLHAFAGAGKTTTAREFGRWYVDTGGAADLLWTSFEHYTPLARVLDVVGTAFAPLLAASDIHWAAITDAGQRRSLVLQLLSQQPLLWVWDNVEPVAGFPTGTTSAWRPEEQRELAAFLRDVAQTTQARVLLTSRRDESEWLGALAYRVWLPPMPMRERLQLAHALAPEARPDVDWQPLLRFTGGNPLTITVAVRQAVRDNRGDASTLTSAAVADFAGRVRAGAAPLEDTSDATQGRDRSLAASLDYGFRSAFTAEDRAKLAVLHLFRETVDVDALCLMGERAADGRAAVPALAGLTREAGLQILDRAVEVGLLTPYGSGYYGIHPALPWYFTHLYRELVGPPGSPAAAACEREYAYAYGIIGKHYHDGVEDGQTATVLDLLRVEEQNFLHALQLARLAGQVHETVTCLQGIKQLYEMTGRTTELARLIAEVQGDFVDLATDQPLPGREETYGVIMSYRVRVASGLRDWPTATRLQQATTDWARRRAAPYREAHVEDLDKYARNILRSLAICEQDLGNLLIEKGDPACLDHYQAAYDLTEQIGDRQLQAVQAFKRGDAYLYVPALRDLDLSQHWYQRSLDLTAETDPISLATSHGSLANVAQERASEAFEAGAPEAEVLEHLDTALTGHLRALELLPDDHHDHRARLFGQLGNLYASAGDVPQALREYHQCIHHAEACGDVYTAGLTRCNIALLLGSAGRVDDALQYARAALVTLQAVGPGAADPIVRVEELIRQLEG